MFHAMYDDSIAEKLRAVDYDLNRLTDTERTELFSQARKCGIQIWHRDFLWSSQAGNHHYSDAATYADQRSN